MSPKIKMRDIHDARDDDIIELSDEELEKRMAEAELKLQPKTGWLSIYQRCVGSILKGATLVEDNRA